MLDLALARARYAAGNAVRLATRPWRQWSISPAHATTLFGCGFGDAGWHHIRQTLREVDADPGLRPAQSTLWRYLSGFLPGSISLLAGVADEEPLSLFEYPWGTFSAGYVTGPKDPAISRFCGPSTDAFITDEFQRTLRLYQRLRASGYQPMRYPNSFIGGSWLLAADGQRRFVVMQGNHRMAILAHLGLASVAVRNVPQAIHAVHEDDLERWPLVRSGRCSQAHARQVFRYFFENSGWQVAARLG